MTASRVLMMSALALCVCAAAAAGAGPAEPSSGNVYVAAPVLRDIQETIWFQGFLADVATGEPITGSYSISARIYDSEGGGTSLWGPETHFGIPVDTGWFNIELGSIIGGLPAFDTPPYYLQLTVEGELLNPRLKLGSVPSAFQSLSGGGGFDLPYSGTHSEVGAAFDITSTGPDLCARFRVNNIANDASAVFGVHNGTGPAVLGQAEGNGTGVKGVSAGNGPAIHGLAMNDGLAGEFEGAVIVQDSLSVSGLLLARGNAVVEDTLAVAEGFWFAKDPVPGYVLRCADTWGNAEWAPPNVVAGHSEDANVTIGSVPTQYDDSQVSLTVPGAGHIIVTSTVRVHIDHTPGFTDRILLNHSTSPSDMGLPYSMVEERILADMPTIGAWEKSYSVHSIHSVTSEGTYTYYLVGQMAEGASVHDEFFSAQMMAVYYPHPVR